MNFAKTVLLIDVAATSQLYGWAKKQKSVLLTIAICFECRKAYQNRWKQKFNHGRNYQEQKNCTSAQTLIKIFCFGSRSQFSKEMNSLLKLLDDYKTNYKLYNKFGQYNLMKYRLQQLGTKEKSQNELLHFVYLDCTATKTFSLPGKGFNKTQKTYLFWFRFHCCNQFEG